MLSVIACMPVAYGGCGGGAVYVDTESRFCSARLVEIATGRFPECYQSAAAVEVPCLPFYKCASHKCYIYECFDSG